MQWLHDNGKKANNDRSNNTHKTEDWTTQTPLKPRKFRCFGRVRPSYATSGTRRGTLVINPVMNHERGKYGIVTHIYYVTVN